MEGCEHVLLRVGTSETGAHDLLPSAGGELGVVACGECATIDWWGPGGLVAATDALGRLFGNLELVGRLPAVGAPAPQVYAYRPPSAKERRHLVLFPIGTWLRAHPHLWLSTDGALLLLAPTDPAVAAHIDRGA